MAKGDQLDTGGHGGARAHSLQQRRHQKPVHQEGSEQGQLPPPGYLIDSSNHPRWVDTLKSNQSLREPVAGDCRYCHGNYALVISEVHSGPSPAS